MGGLHAAGWGFLAGSALIIGALAGFFVNIPQRIIAAITAFGSGVLISALSLNLMEEAYEKGGFVASAAGFFGGALVFTIASWFLDRRGRSTASAPGISKKRSRSSREADWRLPWERFWTGFRNRSSLD